jgi:putative membrane protein
MTLPVSETKTTRTSFLEGFVPRPTHPLLVALSLAIAGSLHAQNPAPAAAPDLSDPEVAHVAVTANSIDIDMAKFAQTRSTDAAVKQFAATMITDHTAVNAQAADLAKKLGVTPADNVVSQSLEAGAKQARASLEPLQGRAFDRAYMDREVAYHQAVLDAIDKLLIPTTENAELKQLLTAVRPAVATHLEHAKQVRTQLGTAPRTSQ